jgi:hypothetical protein
MKVAAGLQGLDPRPSGKTLESCLQKEEYRGEIGMSFRRAWIVEIGLGICALHFGLSLVAAAGVVGGSVADDNETCVGLVAEWVGDVSVFASAAVELTAVCKTPGGSNMEHNIDLSWTETEDAEAIFHGSPSALIGGNAAIAPSTLTTPATVHLTVTVTPEAQQMEGVYEATFVCTCTTL